MKIKEIIPYAKQKKQVGISFLLCVACLVVLIAQLILMNRTPIDVIFLFLIPGVCIVSFAFHGITLTEDRPTMLTLMPASYLLSLLIKELIAVEIGSTDTYPYIPLIEFVPFFFFAFSMATKRGKKLTVRIIRVWIVMLAGASVIVAISTLFFNIRITHQINNVKATFGMICGFIGVILLYASMMELTQIAGSKVNGIPCFTKRSDSISGYQ